MPDAAPEADPLIVPVVAELLWVLEVVPLVVGWLPIAVADPLCRPVALPAVEGDCVPDVEVEAPGSVAVELCESFFIVSEDVAPLVAVEVDDVVLEGWLCRVVVWVCALSATARKAAVPPPSNFNEFMVMMELGPDLPRVCALSQAGPGG